MNEPMYTSHILEQLSIPLERNNEDEGRTNRYGMKLLDLCRRCSLFIGMKLLDLCRRCSLFIGMKLLD